MTNGTTIGPLIAEWPSLLTKEAPDFMLGEIPIRFVLDRKMPPDQIEFRGPNGYVVRVVNVRFSDEPSEKL